MKRDNLILSPQSSALSPRRGWFTKLSYHIIIAEGILPPQVWVEAGPRACPVSGGTICSERAGTGACPYRLNCSSGPCSGWGGVWIGRALLRHLSFLASNIRGVGTGASWRSFGMQTTDVANLYRQDLHNRSVSSACLSSIKLGLSPNAHVLYCFVLKKEPERFFFQNKTKIIYSCKR